MPEDNEVERIGEVLAIVFRASSAHPSSDPASPARHSSIALMAFSPPIVPLARLAKGRLEVSLKGRREDCRERYVKNLSGVHSAALLFSENTRPRLPFSP
jgi:hypothetical protein